MNPGYSTGTQKTVRKTYCASFVQASKEAACCVPKVGRMDILIMLMEAGLDRASNL